MPCETQMTMDEEEFLTHSKKHRFQIKGKNAEEWVHEIAFLSFLKDWCVPNPKRPDGKEICDLLIVFGDTAFIWQIKDIKYTDNDNRFVRKAIDEPISQVFGAERYLARVTFDLNLRNAYGIELKFDPKSIKNTFRIVASLGQANVFLPIAVEHNDNIVHVMDRSLEEILNELDTIRDFEMDLTLTILLTSQITK